MKCYIINPGIIILKIWKPKPLYEYISKVFFKRIKGISQNKIFEDSPQLFYTIG